MRFIAGLASGIFLSTSLVALATGGDSVNELAKLLKPAFNGLWTGATNNLRLGKLSGEMTPSPNVADDYPFLTLTTAAPALTLDRTDVKTVCLRHLASPADMPTFSVEIFLTPEARLNVANQLAGHDGEAYSFRMLGVEVSSFHVDAAKVQALKDHLDFYAVKELLPGEIAEGIPDEDMFWMTMPDITYTASGSGIYQSLTFARYLAGSKPLQGCDPDVDPATLPGYAEHTAHWNGMAKLFRDGQMKKLGYDN